MEKNALRATWNFWLQYLKWNSFDSVTSLMFGALWIPTEPKEKGNSVAT